MKAKPRDILLGLGIGIGLGLLALAGMALLIYPRYVATHTVPPATVVANVPSPSASPGVTPSVISIPPTATPTSMPTPTPIIHIVQDGDALFNLAIQYGTTVEAIKAANGLDSDTIYAGQRLLIPPPDVVLPSPTPVAEGEVTIYTVVSGDTLSGIAARYGVTIEALMSANGLTSDAIQAGQELVIPLGNVAVGTPVGEPGAQGWQPSPLAGDLDAVYSLTVEEERFTLHYQPGSLPAQELGQVVHMVETAQAHIEETLQVHLEGRFNAYAAGSLFAPPDMALRGRSFSSQRRFFFLYDGTGTPADRQYILTHELTHLTTWNTMGQPASVMLHEGVAVYVGMKLAQEQDASYIPLEEFCFAYHQAGRLPSLSASPSFQGHIRDLDTYYAAGCLVQYLIERYGPEKFATAYRTGDYYSVYGQSLVSLEAEWIAALETANYSLSFDPDDLVYNVNRVADAYDRLFAGFTGTADQMAAYRELDRARMALLQGRFDDVETHLATFDDLLE